MPHPIEGSMKNYIYDKLLAKLIDMTIDNPAIKYNIPDGMIEEIYQKFSHRNTTRCYYQLMFGILPNKGRWVNMTDNMTECSTLDYIFEVDIDWFEDENSIFLPWTDKTFTKEMYKKLVVCFDMTEYRQRVIDKLV